MEAAVRNDTFDTITYARPLDVADTFRLLADSIDFMDGSGWEILIDICPVSPGPREALLLWMLRLSSSDMKTYGKKENYALLWVIMTIGGYTGLVEATRLLLCLGGPELINTPFFNRASYTVLHVHAMYCASKENMSLVPAHGPDIHRLGFADFYSPEEESPFSLVLYSSWAFKDWLDALFTVEKDFEEFVTEEFRRNHTRHPGWEKETLLALSTYEYLTDYMPQQPWKCDDCTKTIFYIRVQPHWRHFLERIKQGIYPYDSAEASSEVDEEGSEEDGSIAGTASNAGAPADLDDTYSEVDEEGSKDDEGIGGAVNNTDDPADLDEISSDMGHDPESASDSVSESKPGFSRLSELDTGDPHGYHSTVSLQSECVYCPHEAICMSCWLFYVRTGTRRCGRRRPFSCSECDE